MSGFGAAAGAMNAWGENGACAGTARPRAVCFLNSISYLSVERVGPVVYAWSCGSCFAYTSGVALSMVGPPALQPGGFALPSHPTPVSE